MKHLKTFEELLPSTYLSAANKLGSEHPTRSSEVRDWAIKDVKDKVFTFMVKTKDLYYNGKSGYVTDAFCSDRKSAIELKKMAKEYLNIDNLNINSIFRESYDDNYIKVDTKFDGKFFVPIISQRGVYFVVAGNKQIDDEKIKIDYIHIDNNINRIKANVSNLVDKTKSEPSGLTPPKVNSRNRWQKIKDKFPSWKESYM